MRRFIASSFDGDTVTLDAEERNHAVRVLRLTEGDEILVARGEEECVCEISEIGKDYLKAEIRSKSPLKGEPACDVRLYMAYMKKDKMEWIVQKGTELGLSVFIPFISEHCVKIPEGDSAANAMKRYCRISDEALKQCGRNKPLKVREAISFDDLIEELGSQEGTTLFANVASEGSLKNALLKTDKTKPIRLIVGPEGGFSSREVLRIISTGATSVSLGGRVLRGETAAISLMGIVNYETGN